MLAMIAIVVLIAVGYRQGRRLSLLQRELGALRSLVLSLAPSVHGPVQSEPTDLAAAAIARTGSTTPSTPTPSLPPLVTGEQRLTDDPLAADKKPPEPISTSVPKIPSVLPAGTKPDFETALGTRWAVWIGGLALALGGVFLVRYSIEAGLFGPGMRVALAALFGLALFGAGEAVRRYDFHVPAAGVAGAYIPAILTAAGAFTLFGTIYAAYALYGFLEPASAFVLLGIVGLGTMVLALRHGQALAGVGLLGSLVTPALISSQSPDVWILFGYLAIVLLATVGIARIRRWRFLASSAFLGTGFWTLAYMADSPAVSLAALLFISGASLAVLALVWSGLAGLRARPAAFVFPSAVPAFFVGLTALALAIDPDLGLSFSRPGGFGLLAVMFLIAALWLETLPLAVGAAFAAFFIAFRIGFVGTFSFEAMGEPIHLDAFVPGPDPSSLWVGQAAICLLLVVVGVWQARELVRSAPRAASMWAILTGVVPQAVNLSFWLALGNPDRDLGFAGSP